MAAEKMKCPICGTKLKNVNGRMTCKECGYYVREQNGSQTCQGQQTASPAAGSSLGQSSAGAFGAYQSSGNGQSSGRYQSCGQSSKNKGTGIKLAVACISVCAGIVLGILIYFARTGLSDLVDRLASFDTPAQSHRSEEQLASTEYYPSDDVPESESQDRAKPAAGIRLPKSSFFQEMTSVIFGKEYTSVTPEEYDSITAIEINKEEHYINYLLRGQEEYQSLTFSNTVGMELSDLACFTGLEGIWLDDDLSRGDLNGLQNLPFTFF